MFYPLGYEPKGMVLPGELIFISESGKVYSKRLIKKEIHIITNRTSSVVKHHARTRREKGTCDTTSESEAETNGDGSDVARRQSSVAPTYSLRV